MSVDSGIPERNLRQMKSRGWKFGAVLLVTTAFSLARPTVCPAEPAETQTLWTVGKADGDNAEFAHAPKDYLQVKQDGYFVVGRSEAGRDWPYVHPGPGDPWAGSRQHTFTVVFGLQDAREGNPCRLLINLLDTHSSNPPRLSVVINGKSFVRSMPQGGGDDSVFGDPAKGRKYNWHLGFDSGLLRAGDNEISVTTLSGCWVMYDSLRLETPADLKLKPVPSGTRLVGVDVPPVWLKEGGKPVQPVAVTLRHIGEDLRQPSIWREADRRTPC